MPERRKFDVDVTVTRIYEGTVAVWAEDEEHAETLAEREAERMFGSAGGAFSLTETYVSGTDAQEVEG